MSIDEFSEGFLIDFYPSDLLLFLDGLNDELNIAEIFHETGEVKQRYSRYLSRDGCKWVRHGFFRMHYRNGNVASEGNYVHGKEEGLWKDYHESGGLAAQGHYEGGKEIGEWKYWNSKGQEE